MQEPGGGRSETNARAGHPTEATGGTVVTFRREQVLAGQGWSGLAVDQRSLPVGLDGDTSRSDRLTEPAAVDSVGDLGAEK